MHYFSNLFDKVLYMFRTDLLSGVSTLCTQQQVRVFALLVMLTASEVRIERS